MRFFSIGINMCNICLLYTSGEKEYQGRGIAYCATCDGEFFEGCPIFVIGGGFAACEEALFLTQYASKVTMLSLIHI